jgi:hypothetical protein
MLSVFGGGVASYSAPAVELRTPGDGAPALPATVTAEASGKRGVARLALFLNGFPYAEAPGAEFGEAGQPATTYGLEVPAGVPAGVTEVFVRAYDDLGASSDSATVTVMNGAPCTADAQCLAEQHCVTGGCRWDPPVGELGDACAFPAFCKSFQCASPDDSAPICTERCEVGDPDACPSGLACDGGLCVIADGGGCCSAGGGGTQCVGLVALLGWVLLRRRKNRE